MMWDIHTANRVENENDSLRGYFLSVARDISCGGTESQNEVAGDQAQHDPKTR